MRSIFAMIKSIFQKIIDLFRIRGVGPVIVEPDTVDPGEVVCYYGCPNSKKAKKLQLSKTLYR